MREKILKNLANWHASHPWRMALIVLLLTVIFFAFATQLSVTTRTSDLLPEHDPKVVQFNKIIDEFTTATSLIVFVQGEEKRIKEFADELAPQIQETIDTSSNDSLQEQIDKLQKKIDKLKEKGKESKVAELHCFNELIIKWISIS
jgi:predicted RND superfamily exporter protein